MDKKDPGDINKRFIVDKGEGGQEIKKEDGTKAAVLDDFAQ